MKILKGDDRLIGRMLFYLAIFVWVLQLGYWVLRAFDGSLVAWAEEGYLVDFWLFPKPIGWAIFCGLPVLFVVFVLWTYLEEKQKKRRQRKEEAEQGFVNPVSAIY